MEGGSGSAVSSECWDKCSSLDRPNGARYGMDKETIITAPATFQPDIVRMAPSISRVK